MVAKDSFDSPGCSILSLPSNDESDGPINLKPWLGRSLACILMLTGFELLLNANPDIKLTKMIRTSPKTAQRRSTSHPEKLILLMRGS